LIRSGRKSTSSLARRKIQRISNSRYPFALHSPLYNKQLLSSIETAARHAGFCGLLGVAEAVPVVSKGGAREQDVLRSASGGRKRVLRSLARSMTILVGKRGPLARLG
jgi:hypothetical protein